MVEFSLPANSKVTKGRLHPSKETPSKGMYGATWTQWDNTFYAAKYLAESLWF